MDVQIVYPLPASDRAQPEPGFGGGEHGQRGTALVSLRGQLDVDTSVRLERALDELRGRRVNHLVIDLAELDFCDSIGLSALIVAHRYCVDNNGWLRLASPTAFLLRLMYVVGVAAVVPIYRGAEAALAGERTALIQADLEDETRADQNPAA